MITIPAIPKNQAPWDFECSGYGPKFIKQIIPQICKVVLFHEKITKKDLNLELILKTPDQIAIFNEKYLQKQGPTDVISFPIETDIETIKNNTPPTLGSILFCWTIIKQNAQKNEKDEIKHLAHIVVHGMLHLLGHEHEVDYQKMQAKEVAILKRMGVEPPYLEK